MGERKGQNFYYPPDFDYKKHKTLNSYHGTHALRERAAKIKQGILIIRFEMPFNIWCLGCNNHVGMGVRYNAEKKKVGMYHTTPVFEFRMRCHLCENYFIIRTDPEHFDYELIEGCRRQEKRYDPSTINQLGAVDRGFSRQLEADKMFKVEHGELDKNKTNDVVHQIEKLEYLQNRMRDDYNANRTLRQHFRTEKKEIADRNAVDDDLRRRTSLNIALLPEADNDVEAAKLIRHCHPMKSFDEQQKAKRACINRSPLFEPSKTSNRDKSVLEKRMNAKRKKVAEAFFTPTFSTSKANAELRNRFGIIVKAPSSIDTRIFQQIPQEKPNAPFVPKLYVKNHPAEKNHDASAAGSILVDYSSSSDSLDSS